MHKKLLSPLVIALFAATLLGCELFIFSSFMADDFILLGKLEGVSPLPGESPAELYTLADGSPEGMQAVKNRGAFPWFFNPHFKMRFFRPLSAMLLALDHRLFGLEPLGYTVHTLLWFLLLVAALGFLFKRTLPEETGKIAILIFAVSGVHYIVLFWASSRHILTAAALGAWGLYTYVRNREDGWKPGIYLAPFFFLLSLLAGEAGIGMAAYLAAYEITRRGEPLMKRFFQALPVLLVVLGYLIYYASAGYGAAGGSSYFSPLSEPSAFLAHLPPRLSSLLGAIFLGGLSDTFLRAPTGMWPVLAVGIFFIGCIFFMSRPGGALASRDKPYLKPWLWGMLLAALPFCAAEPFSQRAVIPFTGGSVIVAALVVHWKTQTRKRKGFIPRLWGVLGVTLLIIHLFMGPTVRIFSPGMLKKLMNTKLASAMETLPIPETGLKDKKVIIPASPGLVIGLHSYFYRRLHRLPMPQSWWVLSWEPCPHHLHRTGETSFALELIDRPGAFPYIKTGQTITLDGMTATLKERRANGTVRVECELDRPPREGAYIFLAWKDGSLHPFQLPPVGERMVLK